MRKNESKFITNFFSESGTKKLNNDYFGYVCLDNVAIWVIADGYDEDKKGGISSKLVVEKIIEHFILNPVFSSKNIKEIVNYANFCVHEKQREINSEVLMYCSVSIIVTNYHSYFYGGVGNCRMYHLRGGYVISQSCDDTIAQSLVEEGYLEVENIRNHRQRNDLLKSIGDVGNLKVNVMKNPVELEEEDSLILTTLGFWENVDDRELEEEVLENKDRKKLVEKLKKKIQFSESKEVENNTFVIIDVEKTATKENVGNNRDRNRKILIAVGIVALVVVGMNLYFWREKNNILKNIEKYENSINENIEERNFNNVIENIKLEKLEYMKLNKGSGGVIGFITFGSKRKNIYENGIKENGEKLEKIGKIKNAFENIMRGNEFFGSGDYDEAFGNYERAKYILEENDYKRDELKSEEIISTLNERINAIGKLKEAKNLEIIGETEEKAGNYKEAMGKYKEALNIYLVNGRGDYVNVLEEKILKVEQREKNAYSDAISKENQGDLFSLSNFEMSKEAYVKAREMYQILGDNEKVKEIENKLSEINSKKIVEQRNANEKLEMGLREIMAGDVTEGVTKLLEVKRILKNIGDESGALSIDGFINKAKDYTRLEEKNKKTLDMEREENRLKLELKEAEIRKEKEKLEKISKMLEKITVLEVEGERLFLLKRYEESIGKYEEAKGVYGELKENTDFENKNVKVEQIEGKIMEIEIIFYEVEGDKEYKNKDYKEAEKKYKLSMDRMEKVEMDVVVKDRIEKKYNKVLRKNNKKWWELWK